MEIKIIPIDRNTPDKVLEDCAHLLLAQMVFINDPSSLERVENALQLAISLPETTKVFAARGLNDEIVGILFANKGSSVAKSGYYLWINELHVKESERENGIATALLQHVFEWCKENIIAGITLGASMDNDIAKNLYLKQGFTSEEMRVFNKIL